MKAAASLMATTTGYPLGKRNASTFLALIPAKSCAFAVECRLYSLHGRPHNPQDPKNLNICVRSAYCECTTCDAEIFARSSETPTGRRCDRTRMNNSHPTRQKRKWRSLCRACPYEVLDSTLPVDVREWHCGHRIPNRKRRAHDVIRYLADDVSVEGKCSHE